jgi:endonuclease YncB( thermonuclease family)
MSPMKTAGLFCAVAIGVFALGMLITHLDGVAIPGAIWTRVSGATSTCQYISVHDGDTIRCGTERIRLLGIDAPELSGSPRCEDERAALSWCDDELERRSRDALQAFLRSGRVEVTREGKDKYGRTLAVVRVDGRDAGDYLIQVGLAKAYR